jgi:DNA-binding response OmpR family regulator
MNHTSVVLVIEDHPGVLRLIASGLRAAGIEPLEAPTALDGVRLARRRRPDLIITDLDLPGMSGGAAAESILHDPGLRSVPLIVVSGLPEVHVKGREIGAVETLAKPFILGDLVFRVRRLLDASVEAPPPAR